MGRKEADGTQEAPTPLSDRRLEIQAVAAKWTARRSGILQLMDAARKGHNEARRQRFTHEAEVAELCREAKRYVRAALVPPPQALNLSRRKGPGQKKSSTPVVPTAEELERLQAESERQAKAEELCLAVFLRPTGGTPKEEAKNVSIPPEVDPELWDGVLKLRQQRISGEASLAAAQERVDAAGGRTAELERAMGLTEYAMRAAADRFRAVAEEEEAERRNEAAAALPGADGARKSLAVRGAVYSQAKPPPMVRRGSSHVVKK